MKHPYRTPAMLDVSKRKCYLMHDWEVKIDEVFLFGFSCDILSGKINFLNITKIDIEKFFQNCKIKCIDCGEEKDLQKSSNYYHILAMDTLIESYKNITEEMRKQ